MARQAGLESSLCGGHAFSTPDIALSEAIVARMQRCAQSLDSCASEWDQTTIHTQTLRSQAPLCPVLGGGVASGAPPGISNADMTVLEPSVHTQLDVAWLAVQSAQTACDLQALASAIADMASLLSRAYSLYSQAEQTTLRLITGLIMGQSVSHIAHGIGVHTSAFSALLQGNVLRVNPVNGSALPPTVSVNQALENLATVASADDARYATIAIQRYRDMHGAHSWVVTIPGTDSHRDSPLGWLQNLEVMSARQSERLQADSVRFVLEAMRQSGIQPSDPVALVGHSQGGIVAATIAADASEQYQISHIITAGSPIANHPIAQDTWVTSIELDCDIVPQLDGRHNPMSQHWLTVRAQSSDQQDDSAADSDTDEHDAQDESSLGFHHSIAQQQEAWHDALRLGSPATREHNAHVRALSEGTLEETVYFEGRLQHLS